MVKMKLLKNLRFIFLLSLLLISFYFLSSSLFLRNFGVIVINVAEDSKCNLKTGDIITSVLGTQIRNIEDFRIVVSTVKEGEYVAFVVNNGPGGCIATKDSYLGLNVIDAASMGIKFGLEIGGGNEILIKSKTGNLEKANKIINTRIDSLSLPGTETSVSDGFIKIRTIEIEKIDDLITKGDFEGKILRKIEIENRRGEIKVENNKYHFELINKKIKINNSIYGEGQSFLLENITFELINVTNESVTIEAIIFDNEDVLNVLDLYAYVKYNSALRAYEFSVPLEISNESSNKFQKITKGLGTSFMGNRIVLDGVLVYYLDEERINTLNIPIPYEWVGKKIDNIAVVGFKNSQIEALDEKAKIIAILKSGKLPDLKIVKIEHFRGRLNNLISLIMFISISGTISFVLFSSFEKYKNIKVGMYISLLILSEIICITGLMVITQKLFSYGWVIDIFSLIGLAVFVITGIGLTIPIKDRRMQKSFKLFEIGLSVFSFLLLFTPWRGFGLTIITGIIIRNVITNDLSSKIKR